MNIEIRMSVLIVLTVIAVVNDLRSYKIRNEIIIAGVLVGGILLLCEVIERGSGMGYIVGTFSVLGGMFLVFLVRGIGAGDVKLLTVAGLIVGSDVIWIIIAISFAAAAVIGGFSMLKGGRKVAIKLSEQKSVQLHAFHFSIAILAGELIWSGLRVF